MKPEVAGAAFGTVLGLAIYAAVMWRRRAHQREFDRQVQCLLDFSRSIAASTPMVITCNGEGPAPKTVEAVREAVQVATATRVRCKVCGRPLIKHASQERGFGPTCHKRVQALEAEPPGGS